MSGGGKGGESVSKVELDPRLEEGAAVAISGALQSAGLDYAPNRGVSIAGFSPQQRAAFEGADQAASAFGLPTSGGNLGIPATQADPTTGIEGYATGGIYDTMRDSSVSPEQQAERRNLLNYYKQSGRKLSGGAGANGGYGGYSAEDSNSTWANNPISLAYKKAQSGGSEGGK